MTEKFTVGLVQMHCSPEPDDNIERAAAHVREAAKLGATVICLPELFRTQYFCQREDAALFDLAEPVPGPTSGRFSQLAKELHVTIVVSLFERRAPGLYHNTAVVIGVDGTITGKYRKMHIPDDPLYYEKYYFTPGDLGYKVFDGRKRREAGNARLLGSMVSGRRAADGPARRARVVLSDGDRLASIGKSRMGKAAT